MQLLQVEARAVCIRDEVGTRESQEERVWAGMAVWTCHGQVWGHSGPLKASLRKLGLTGQTGKEGAGCGTRHQEETSSRL